ncbi:MAG: penicillin-binding transpeptidase domain-containing protein [Firmicutes bacterium]|nr:penicillin-binding transpeptidase domain-containing protein [Bacillota bacterium]
MERISRFRAIMLLVLFSLVLVLFAVKLFDLQIIETDGNTDNIAKYTTITTVRAARGDILDRNGNVLVGNRASYDLVFNHYVIKSYGQTNEALYALVKKCQELNITYNDHFPVSKTRPFEYTLNDFATSWQTHFQSFMVDRELDSDITAPLLIQKLRDRYKIPEEWSDEDARAVIGIRYEFDLRGISNLPTYTFIEDVSDDDLSAILELNTPGLMVESSTVREYHTKYGAHILGYMGGMDADDWEKYGDLGYSMDAYIGQSGFEEAFEDYLHGIDGQRVDVVSRDGTIVQQFYRVDQKTGNVYTPVAGNNVETTIDIELQGIAEDSLEKVMKQITDPELRTAKDDGAGLDAEGAAVVVMKVKTGEILACASYPTFNLATMNQDWAKIEEDPMKPFFNRAFGAAYAPGSTFKMCTLVAAMENRDKYGNLLYTPGEIITDKGVFTKYEGFSPTCLIWSSNPGVTHGDLDATAALKVSCNYFFYELGSRMTIDMLDETAKGLGLGEHTGIEMVEKIGSRTNAESKKAAYGPTGVDSQITAGDRVLAAIGQAENRFTPLQLCVYASTLANQGTRMKATFLSRVVSSDYNSLIMENSPQIMSQMEISSTTYNTYIEGMRKVITEYGGTACKYFGGNQDLDPFPVAVCAKTGTAQHSSGGSDHGSFICFAPMDDPEIAVAIYGEKAAHGSSLAPVAEDVLRAYFAMEAASEVTAFENQVG